MRISEEVADGKYIRVDCTFSDHLEARLIDEDIHCVLTDSLGDVQLLNVCLAKAPSRDRGWVRTASAMMW